MLHDHKSCDASNDNVACSGRVVNARTYRNLIPCAMTIEGARALNMCTLDGSEALRRTEFTLCDVNKALGSVSNICGNGNRVVFENGDYRSYVENLKTGEKVYLREANGVYVYEVRPF